MATQQHAQSSLSLNIGHALHTVTLPCITKHSLLPVFPNAPTHAWKISPSIFQPPVHWLNYTTDFPYFLSCPDDPLLSSSFCYSSKHLPLLVTPGPKNRLNHPNLKQYIPFLPPLCYDLDPTSTDCKTPASLLRRWHHRTPSLRFCCLSTPLLLRLPGFGSKPLYIMDTSYLAQQVNNSIGQLHGLFDEIGVPNHEREARESEVSNYTTAANAITVMQPICDTWRY